MTARTASSVEVAGRSVRASRINAEKKGCIMNQKVLLGGIAVVVIAVAAYFIFFSGSSGRCSQSAMEAMAPKMQVAVQETLTKDPSKADEIMKKAQAIAEAGAAGKMEEACDLSYKLAEELGVK